MAKITINNIDVQLPPLTYGVVKANKEVVEQVTAEGLDYMARIEAGAAFLHLSAPSADLDSVPPSVILAATKDLYGITFHQREEAAS
jgi:hypothetical protein